MGKVFCGYFFCVYRLLCVKVVVCVWVCVCICVNMFLCVILCLRAHNLLYRIPCLSLTTKTLTSLHLLILTSTHNEHIYMTSSNILMNIFMQVFGVYKLYNYIIRLSTYTPTRSEGLKFIKGICKEFQF